MSSTPENSQGSEPAPKKSVKRQKDPISVVFKGEVTVEEFTRPLQTSGESSTAGTEGTITIYNVRKLRLSARSTPEHLLKEFSWRPDVPGIGIVTASFGIKEENKEKE